MIKALLVDGDGIVLKKSDIYFSDRLRKEGHSFSKVKEKEFFKKVYPNIRLGKKNLKEEVSKYLEDWGWNKSVDKLLEYWFSFENQLDHKVLELLQKIRNKGVKLYLVSDHSKYRADDLWENVGLKNHFDGHFFSCDLHTTKDNPVFFKKILNNLNLQPNEVVFFDDEEENVESARSLEIISILYNSPEQVKEVLNNL